MAREDFRDSRENFARGDIIGGLREYAEGQQHLADGYSHLNRGYI